MKSRFESLYKLQYKACQIVKHKVGKEERKQNIMKATKIYNRILQLANNYDELNLVNESLSHELKM